MAARDKVLPGVADRARRLEWWQDARFGMFIHWGLYALPGRHEWVKSREKMSDKVYEKFFRHFNPDLYNPREWARMAKAAGMKYFVITTKHHEGFCLWDTRYTDYKAPNTPYGQDLVKSMVEAFRAEGLRVGFYYSLLDWHHPDYPVDKHHPQRDDKAAREESKKRDVSKYARYMRDQVKELLTKYGRIDLLWFDFSFPGEDGKGRNDWESEKLLAMIRKLQPHILIDNRLDLKGSGDFVTPEQFIPDTDPLGDDGKPAAWEACHTFSGSWGYYRDEYTWKSVPTLIRMLIDIVSRGGNLLLNVGPTSRGQFDSRAVAALEGMGAWMKQHSRAIYGCGKAPAGLVPPTGCEYTYNAKTKTLYCHVFSWPCHKLTIPGLANKMDYAQLLHDGSEVWFHGAVGSDQAVQLPANKPNVEVPVVEIFLK